MTYIALKPCRLAGRNYLIGKAVDVSTMDANSISTAVVRGLIVAQPSPTPIAPENPVIENPAKEPKPRKPKEPKE